MEHYLVVKNIEVMKFAGKFMQMETIILSEITQIQKDQLCIFLLICGF